MSTRCGAPPEIICKRQRATPGRSTTHHFRQRPAVHGQGLQGIHPHRRYDARPHVTALSAIKRENRTLAQITQSRVHWPRNAGCLPTSQAPAPKVCGSLQYSALHSAIGYVTPQDMLAGRRAEIHAARDHKLEEARRQRQLRRQAA